jgi:maintenance of mitochondrial morphology protein 1
MIAQFRDDARVNNAIVQSMDEVFNGDRKPGFLGEIKITELALGDEFPRFSNCRILPFPGDSNRLVPSRFPVKIEADVGREQRWTSI